MKPDEHPFQPGVGVILRRSGLYSSTIDRVDMRTVEKVYKNGNFVLKGDAQRQQYYARRATWKSDAPWCAYRTGDHYDGSMTLELLTPETRSKAEAEVREHRRQVAFREASQAIYGLGREGADAKLMADVTKAWRDFEARQAAEAKAAAEKETAP